MKSLSRFSPLRVIDSHTGGEPTRTVLVEGLDLGKGSVAERRLRFKASFDLLRSAIINEPRGSDVLVGALLVPPTDRNAVAGVIFFNNVDCLWMCGHGMIGVVVTLGWLGRIKAGRHRFETAVGVVDAEYDGGNRVRIENVTSRRSRKDVTLEVPGVGRIVGDVAWGGNWFFLVKEQPIPLTLSNVEELTNSAWKIRQALAANGITGDDGGEIDHVEFFGPPADPENHSRNFVLCPGKAYDRSPCGTGTSAKIACLADDGLLKPGKTWRQESIVGSVFEASYRVATVGGVIPTIAGDAYITGDNRLIFDADDPFQFGIKR
jgi:4-hydroxyproline epimerase